MTPENTMINLLTAKTRKNNLDWEKKKLQENNNYKNKIIKDYSNNQKSETQQQPWKRQQQQRRQITWSHRNDTRHRGQCYVTDQKQEDTSFVCNMILYFLLLWNGQGTFLGIRQHRHEQLSLGIVHQISDSVVTSIVLLNPPFSLSPSPFSYWIKPY